MCVAWGCICITLCFEKFIGACFNCYMYIHIQNVAVRMCPSLPPSLPLPQVEYNSTLKYSVYVGASEAKFQAEVSKVHTYTNMLYAHCHTCFVDASHIVCTVQMHVVAH